MHVFPHGCWVLRESESGLAVIVPYALTGLISSFEVSLANALFMYTKLCVVTSLIVVTLTIFSLTRLS